MAIQAYFDESGTHAGSQFLCVAGYLFEADACRRFDSAWRRMLADFGVPYFHRAPCEIGEPPFDKLDGTLRRAMRTRAAKIINDAVSYAVIVSVDPAMFERLMPKHPIVGDPYVFCASGCFHAAAVWADDVKYDGPIDYFFESGVATEDHANKVMGLKVGTEAWAKRFRYQSHAFLMKKNSTPLQAADVLAWHWSENWRREFSTDEFARLIDQKGMSWHWTEDMLRSQAEKFNATLSAHGDPFANNPHLKGD